MSAIDDVAVIGGGLAGAAACLSLRQAGLTAVWLAPDLAHADDHEVGDSLAATAVPILRALGVAELLQAPGHRSAQAVFSSWGTDALQQRHAMQQLYGPGYVLDRRAFTADLVTRARQAAVALPQALTGLTATAEGWQLTLDTGAGRTARALVDASGRRAVAARQHTPLHRVDTLVAAWAILPGRDPDVMPTPATLIEAVAEGWWYAALRADGRLSVAFFTDADLMPPGLSRDLAAWSRALARTQHLARWVEDAGFACEAPPRLASAGTTWLRAACGRSHGAPWFAIGDAALALDPLSSHGMTSALWAGSQVGAWVRDSLTGSDTATDHYAGAIERARARYLQERLSRYVNERRFADQPFWQRRHAPPVVR